MLSKWAIKIKVTKYHAHLSIFQINQLLHFPQILLLDDVGGFYVLISGERRNMNPTEKPTETSISRESNYTIDSIEPTVWHLYTSNPDETSNFLKPASEIDITTEEDRKAAEKTAYVSKTKVQLGKRCLKKENVKCQNVWKIMLTSNMHFSLSIITYIVIFVPLSCNLYHLQNLFYCTHAAK